MACKCMAGDEDTLRVVLLGKTGAGKSSLGNSLTGKKPPKTDPRQQRDEVPPDNKTPSEGFRTGRGMKSGTVFCEWTYVDRLGTRIEVTDTPGLCDTHLEEKRIYKEVAKSVAVAEPGPHVIIFTLRCDLKFTQEEYAAYQTIKKLFTDKMDKHMILVFNGMDCYEVETLEEQRAILHDEVRNFGTEMLEMVEQAGNRVFGMNNKTTEKEKERQTQELIQMMKDLVKKNGKDAIYKTEMTDQIMKKVEELVEKEVKVKGTSKVEATTEVKAKIIAEKEPPTFYDYVVDTVAYTASAVTEGVSEMCLVM